MDDVIQVVCGWLFSPDEDRVLLVKNTDRPFWGPPAGGVEKGEFLHPALIRESWEEAGMRVQVNRLLAVGEGFNPTRGHKILFFHFLVEPVDLKQEPSIQSPDEIAEIKWIARQDVAAYLGWMGFNPWDLLHADQAYLHEARIL